MKQEDGTTRASTIDPVCGMSVSPNSASASYEYNGEKYYFCSAHCLRKFQENPESFLQKAKSSAHPVGDKAESKPAATSAAQTFTCPMHPEVRQDKPGSCPKCGMSLEPVIVTAPKEKVEYTCPMHPQIVRDAPGFCPICGMALEPRTVTLDEEENHELKDMKRRFWVSAVLSLPLLVIGMSEFIPGFPLARLVPMTALPWIQLTLASPVVLWGGWPFFVRGWQSIVNRSLNMFTLIGLGVAVAYVYSVIATF
ncbi:MAG: heavy metal-binding domain-containing protein, partial [Pyrinomonadaceae bacterium]